MDKINDLGVGGATCCVLLIQYSEAFNAGLTVFISLLTVAYIGLRVYREVQKIKFYKKKSKMAHKKPKN